MKKFVLFFLASALNFSCTVREKPEFIGVKNIKIIDTNIKNITFSADALFNNPNDLGGKLSTDALKIYVNDVELAKFSSKTFEVPSKETFSIPLTVSVATDSIIDKKSIGGLLGSLISQKLKVQYIGDIKYKVLGYSSTYTVDKTENVKLKL